ncbi:MAG: hypothetical protein HRU34_17135 [Richelia sp.]|nr:hypothetical protein [Richelia sp.]
MPLCINLHCSNPDNSDDMLFCHSYGSELLLEGRYRVYKKLGEGGFGKTCEVSDIRSSHSKVHYPDFSPRLKKQGSKTAKMYVYCKRILAV